jgi:hypothetical protein
MKKSAMIAVAIAGAAAGSAMAGPVTPQILEIDLSNLQSFDGIGAPGNALLDVDLPAGYDTVIGIGWDVTLETFGPSWASEAAFALGDQGLEASLFLRPAAGVNNPLETPTQFTSDIIDLVELELDFSVASGVLSLELFETFDDVEGESDAQWLQGSTLFVQVIPAPGALALLGLSGLVGTRRRRG